MNLAHLHLLLNHFPIIGTLIGVGIFVASFIRRNDDLKSAGLTVFAGVALLTLPAFFSGVGAQAVARRNPAVSATLIERHEGAAILALFFMEITGALALAGLWQHRRISDAKRWSGLLTSIMFVSIVTMGLMARVGGTGGDIHHPEIRSEDSALTSIVQVFEPSPTRFRDLMLVSKWWWAFLMDLHFIGLALLIGTVGLLNLRMLGFLKQLPIAPLHRLMPWAMAGFGVNALTGVLAFIGMPNYYTFDMAFWLKIFALLLLGLNAAAFYLTDAFSKVEHLGSGEDAPASAKFFAVSSLILWFAVIALGRYIQAFSDTISVR
jgi:hypothetical protein